MANYYYSGQGSLYVGARNAQGRPVGLRPVGNVPSLELAIEVTKFEHKESETGQRAIDLTIVQEKNGTFSMTLESITMLNLAMAFWGDAAVVAGAAVVDEEQPAASGRRTPTDHPNWDTGVAPVVTRKEADAAADWAATQAYVVGDMVVPTTPNTHVYVCEVAGTSGGTEPVTWVTDGSTVTDGTVTWRDAGLITPAIGTDVTVDYQNGVIAVPDGSYIGYHASETFEIDYTHLGYAKVDAFTQTSLERYMRFEGLNTVDGEGVIIDIYRASLDPVTGYQLINEELGQLEISGNVLLDTLQQGGSQFFRQINLAAGANDI